MYKILGSRRQNDFSRAVILHPITLLQQLDTKIRRSSGSYLSAARGSLRDIIAACFVRSPMQVALTVTMPWDKIEESQTEPLLGRKLLKVRLGQTRTLERGFGMSALPPKANMPAFKRMFALCHKRTSAQRPRGAEF